MTTAEKLNTIHSACSDIKQAIIEKGQTPSGGIETYAAAVNNITELKGETRTVSITSTSGNTFTPSSGKNGITSIKVNPTNQSLTITPSKSKQTKTVPSNYSGYGTVTCNAVTSSIDSNIKAANIKSGVSILGVSGSLSPVNNTSLAVTPTTSAQSFTPSSPYTGYNSVNVSAVTSAIDSNIQVQFIRNGVQILGITGEYGEPLPPPKVFCPGYTCWYSTGSGELYGCGKGSYGQQGNGTSGSGTNIMTFTKRADNVVQFIGSTSTTWYINKDGELYGCGNGQYGQQGNGDTTNVTTFTKRADHVVQVYSTSSTTWYVNEDGELYGCGLNDRYQQGSGDYTNVTTFTKRADNVKEIVISKNGAYSNTFYIDNNNVLYGCGGQGGGFGISGYSATFTQIATNVKKLVYCSHQQGSTAFYIDNNNVLYGCGKGSYGQQGNGSTQNVTTFTQIATNVKDVSCSIYTTWYINEDGELYGCGINNNGQQGSGDTTDVKTFTKRAENVIAIACSAYTTWYINEDGELYGCGRASDRQQGSGGNTDVLTFTKRAENVVQVDCSDEATWYVNNLNELYGCGKGNNGQQGNNSTSSVSTFTKRN